MYSAYYRLIGSLNKLCLSKRMHNKPFVMHFALLRRKMTRQTEQGVSS